MIYTYGGKLLQGPSGFLSGPHRYFVYINSTTGGTISATPDKGTDGTEITLTNTPENGYKFNSYSLTGATLRNNNKFDISGSNVTAEGSFDKVYKVNLTQTAGGIISATPMSGINGETITLTNAPSSHYVFNGYSLTGSTLYNTNKFDLNGSDVSVKGSFSAANNIVLFNQSTEVASSSATVNINVNNPDTSYYRYWKVQFDHCATTAGLPVWATDCGIYTNIDHYNPTYPMRSHYDNDVKKRHCYLGWGTRTDTQPARSITFTSATCTRTSQDNIALYMTTATTQITAYRTYKYIIDATNGKCSAYIGGVLGGVIAPRTFTVSNIYKLLSFHEQTGSNALCKFKNVKVGVSNTWTGANNL